MRHVVLLALLLATLAPAGQAAASKAQSVQLHDLTEKGAYVGCHVTDAGFGSFRFTVNEGDEVTLTVQAPANNTNVHTLTVEGHDARTRALSAGQSQDLTFTAGAPKSYGVLCDGDTGPLKGVLIVLEAPSSETKDAPAPALPILALAVALALALRRRA